MARISGTQTTSTALVALGTAIRARRKSLGLSQEAVANSAGLDRSHMGKIERGERNVTLLNVMRIAGVLRTSASELLAEAKL
ncbi:MAG: helix-turn-helix domain-containing protein [Sphingomonas sp.]|uniref:helix-turn-helix domain-containing protein n=1 Tax=Sphingomonas sp. TaxID=28214 RepID=UPI003BF08939